MKVETDSYYQEPTATKLEELRAKARSKWRITYDCYNAGLQDNRVVCSKGHSFLSLGSLSLLSVLRGRTSIICRGGCLDYDGD